MSGAPLHRHQHGIREHLLPRPLADLPGHVPPEVAARCPQFTAPLRAAVLHTRTGLDWEYSLAPTDLAAMPVAGEV